MRKMFRATFPFLALSANNSHTGLETVDWLFAKCAHRKSFISYAFCFFFYSCVYACVHLLSCLCVSERGGGDNGCIELKSSTHPTHDPSDSAHYTTPSLSLYLLQQLCCRFKWQIESPCIQTKQRGQLRSERRLEQNCNTNLIMAKKKKTSRHKALQLPRANSSA